jgi:hypothetical protein
MGTIKLDDFCEENGVELLRVDGHDNAILGIIRGTGFPHNSGSPRLVYNIQKIIENLIESGMDDEEAEEFFEYNIIGSYVGEQTPLFADRYSFLAVDTEPAAPKALFDSDDGDVDEVEESEASAEEIEASAEDSDEDVPFPNVPDDILG